MLRFGSVPLEGRLRVFQIDGDETTELTPAQLQNVMDERERVARWRRRIADKDGRFDIKLWLKAWLAAIDRIEAEAALNV